MLDLRPANDETGLTAMFNWCNEAFGLGNTGRRRKSCPYYVLWCRFLTWGNRGEMGRGEFLADLSCLKERSNTIRTYAFCHSQRSE